MSIFNDKALKGVAAEVAKIMAETSHGSHPKTDKEKSLAALAHPKDKITHKDVLVGRGVIKKEEVEQLDEVGDTPAGRKALGSYVNKAIADKSKDRTKGLRKATSRMYKDDYYGKKTNEEVQQIDEISLDLAKRARDKAEHMVDADHDDMRDKPYGYSEKQRVKFQKYVDKKESKKNVKEETELDEAFPTVADAKKRMAAKESPFEKKKISTGTVYSRKYKEEPDEDLKSPSRRARDSAAVLGKGEHMTKKKKMSEMLAVYKDGGLKALNEMLVVEEPDNEQFTKELKDQEASMAGKKKQPSVAAPATKGVKEMPEETDVDPEDFISENEEEFSEEVKDDYARKVDKYLKKKYNKVSEEAEQIDELDERELTKGEAEKKEEYVKGMKKGLSGFKQRYGERAKSVMYATATKMAKKD